MSGCDFKLREFLQNKILWDRERKELHEEIYELQRTEQMWLQHGDVPDSRYSSVLSSNLTNNKLFLIIWLLIGSPFCTKKFKSCEMKNSVF